MRKVLRGFLAAAAFSGAAHGAAVASAVRRVDDDHWIIENRLLTVRLTPSTASILVTDRRSGRVWTQPDSPGRHDRNPFTDVREVADGVSLRTTAGGARLQIQLRLRDDRPRLTCTTSAEDPAAKFGGALSIDPFVPRSAEAYLAVADYCNGHIYPLDLDPFPRTWMSGDRLDMPWVGVSEGLADAGYAVILETPEDSCIDMQALTIGDRKLRCPRVGWLPTKGVFGYPRSASYVFAATGGYAALAAAYREHAMEKGLLVRLADKARANPNVRRLFGACDVWGDSSAAFVREAHAAGIDRMLVHGPFSKADALVANRLGYLTSNYDNYTDILPVTATQPRDNAHDDLPGAAVLNADGSRMPAWLTYDKKVQYMKRCPALWVSRAEEFIRKVLAGVPFLGRFIDVTTAEGLYECFDPQHPLDKRAKQRCGEELLALVRKLGLVVGGEHGIWWGVPHQDYIEGMMSSYQFAWPAGHLIRPKTKDERFDGPYGTDTWANYERWGIGHQYRVPLWELVFHDCVVSTWYWGDASDYLLRADPANTLKKDAYNILYGTMPLLWADGAGSWRTDRETFLRTARTTTHVHRDVATSRMVEHVFVSGDRDLQRSRFSNGTTCVVNFGAASRRVWLANRTYVLPQFGYIVSGKSIVQSRSLVGGAVVTSIHTPEAAYRSDSASTYEARIARDQRVVVRVSGTKGSQASPTELNPRFPSGRVLVYRLASDGTRSQMVAKLPGATDTVRLLPGLRYEFVPAVMAHKPDLALSASLVLHDLGPLRQGQSARLSVRIANRGLADSGTSKLRVYVDAPERSREIAGASVRAPAGSNRKLYLDCPLSAIDGQRQLLLTVDAPSGDLCPSDNRCTIAVEVRPDLSRWEHKREIVVEAGKVDRTGHEVSVTCALANADASSVRVMSVAQGQARSLKAQYDPTLPTDQLCFIPDGAFTAGSVRRFVVAWNGMGTRRTLLWAPRTTLYDTTTATARSMTYSAALCNGVLCDLSALDASGASVLFASKTMVSSQETGWTVEGGTAQRPEVLANGPVRAVVSVRKTLPGNARYTKVYTFYPRRIEVTIDMSPELGSLSRTYFVEKGTFADNRGNSAQIDGSGELEGIGDRGAGVLWFAAYAPRWAMSCATAVPFRSLTYWDSGEWGGIGFVGSPTPRPRISYGIRSGARDAGFAREDQERLASPAAARFVETQSR